MGTQPSLEASGRIDDGGTDADRHNRALYATAEAVAHYEDHATETGLFPQERALLERHFTDPGARVVDVGCGVGRTTRRLADRGFDVEGVDVTPAMVRRAREVFPDLSFQVGDAADLPFETGSFDYALFSFNGLDYLHPERRRRRALSEFRRVLRDGGLVAVSAHNTWYALPALGVDWTYLREQLRTHVEREREGRYRAEPSHAGTFTTYFTNPIVQRRQLRECGLEPVDVVGKHGGPLRYVERTPYFVARA